MINANELRIGNWVLIESHITTVNHIMGDEDYFLPIPLTPEILEKCGFVKNKVQNDCIELGGIDFHLELMWGKENYYYPMLTQTPQGCEERTVFLNRINSLHQLQNLYFALTGQELEVKL